MVNWEMAELGTGHQTVDPYSGLQLFKNFPQCKASGKSVGLPSAPLPDPQMTPIWAGKDLTRA